MRKITLLLVTLFCLGSPAKALDTEYTYKWVTLVMPLTDFYVGALYDFVGKETVGAIETPVLRLDSIGNVALTIGVAGDLSNEGEGELREKFRDALESGTPYLGFNYQIPLWSDRAFVSFGYGFNFKEDKSLAGVNTSFRVW